MMNQTWSRGIATATAMAVLFGFNAMLQADSPWESQFQSDPNLPTVGSGIEIQYEDTYPAPTHRPRKNHERGWFDETTFLFALDGSKQPQDFGVNANLGGTGSVNMGLPVFEDYGIGVQMGTGITASANAVRVYELLGESTGRTQSFTTLGMFQRTENGFSWGLAHDFLYEKSFDTFQLGQWRFRSGYFLNENNEVGVNVALRSYTDSGVFGSATPVDLRAINQGHLFLRHFWETGAQTTFWFGLADEHGENNAVTGPDAPKNNPFLLGADVLMPLTKSLALYGETNLIMPSDTGTVDAFLGFQWYPGGNVFNARRGRFAPLMALASPTSFSVDLRQ